MSQMRFRFSGLRQFWAVALALTLLTGSACWAGELELSPIEQTWLDAHPIIRMSVEAGYGPYIFLDAEGRLQGLATDFFADIEGHLGIRFEIVSNLSWPQQMEAVRERRLDVVATVVKLPEREAFLEFTEIYLPTPLVIMTRSETPQLHSLKQLQQLRLSLVKGFSSSKQLVAQFPDLQPRYVSGPLEGLRLVASGATDAYVGALGVNSFLAARNGITNLKVNAAFNMEDNGQRFGVRKDWPQLARLLDKALLAISEERRNAIFQRWLPQDASRIKRLSRPSYVTRLFPWLLGGLGLALLGYLVLFIFNGRLRRAVELQTQELSDSNTELSGEIAERKRAEEELRAERDKLKSVFAAMDDGVYIVDQDYNIEYVNPVLVADFGPYEGRKCHTYFHDREDVCPWCKNPDVFAGKTVQWEWTSPKNGKTYDLIDAPLTNADGSISKLEIFRDITERKRAEKELEKHRNHLEERVRDRTEGLRKTVNLMAGRENRMVGLKKVVKKLRAQLEDVGITPVADERSEKGEG